MQSTGTTSFTTVQILLLQLTRRCLSIVEYLSNWVCSVWWLISISFWGTIGGEEIPASWLNCLADISWSTCACARILSPTTKCRQICLQSKWYLLMQSALVQDRSRMVFDQDSSGLQTSIDGLWILGSNILGMPWEHATNCTCHPTKWSSVIAVREWIRGFSWGFTLMMMWKTAWLDGDHPTQFRANCRSQYLMPTCCWSQACSAKL